MKKEDFIALGISPELAAKAAEASGRELEGYVPKDQLDTASSENKALKQSIADRDKQLETLKASAGDNEELKKQIETMKQQNASNDQSIHSQLYRPYAVCRHTVHNISSFILSW